MKRRDFLSLAALGAAASAAPLRQATAAPGPVTTSAHIVMFAVSTLWTCTGFVPVF